MHIVHTSSQISDHVARWHIQGERVGFVPTMGALHNGHVGLMKHSQSHAERSVVSIFVNPTQFAPHEDFDRYPRDIEADITLCEAAGVDALYIPNIDEIYTDGIMESTVKAGTSAQGLEGDSRPHFFDGVVNVVARLLAQIQPNIALFGEKDYQQLMVIREMVAAEQLPIEIIGVPIIRDSYGLALSSRNAYLNADELAIARRLNKILRVAKDLEETKRQLLDAGFDRIDYVAERWDRILAAVWIGQTRLIDNLG